MTETEQFLATMGPRITAAEIALHNGDSGPRIAMWSRAEPLTLFGAAISGRGWGEIGPIFDTLGQQFSGCLSVNGAEPKPYVLRVTTIFRREDGEWKVVHRHANAAADPGEVVGRLAPRP